MWETIKNLLKSKKYSACLAYVIAATLFAFFGEHFTKVAITPETIEALVKGGIVALVAAIGGNAFEDGMQKMKLDPPKPTRKRKPK